MGQFLMQLIIDTGSFRSGEVYYDPKLSRGALRNHPYTTDDHPRALLMPQELANHL